MVPLNEPHEGLPWKAVGEEGEKAMEGVGMQEDMVTPWDE